MLEGVLRIRIRHRCRLPSLGCLQQPLPYLRSHIAGAMSINAPTQGALTLSAFLAALASLAMAAFRLVSSSLKFGCVDVVLRASDVPAAPSA